MNRVSSLVLGRGWGVATLVVYVLLVLSALDDAVRAGSGAGAPPGLYAWEAGPPPPPGVGEPRFRWTRKEAEVEVPVAGEVLHVPIYLARPDLDKGPVVLQLQVNGRPLDRVALDTPGWHALTYELAGVDRAAIVFRLEVDRTFVPAHYSPSADYRALGVGLGELWWSPRP